MRYQRILAIGLTTLAASLLAACNTEFGPGDGTDDGSGTAKYPTLDGKRQQSFALTSIDNAPANSRESFAKAFAQNADFIAVDVVVSKDGVLMALPSPDIGASTNVGEQNQYANRKTTKQLDGIATNSWFATDFTAAELQSLRLKPPTGSNVVIDANSFRVQSLPQVIAYAKQQNKTFGLYLQTRNPTFHANQNLAMEDKLVAALQQAGYTTQSSAVVVRSREIGHLKTLRDKTKVRLVQIIPGATLAFDGSVQQASADDRPFDQTLAASPVTYASMVTDEGLAKIKTYADGISPWKPYVISSKYLDKDGDNKADDLNGDGKFDDRDRQMLSPSGLITSAHAAKLFVHPYAFNSAAEYLASDFKGKAADEYKLFYEAGVDGVFSGNPSDANSARK